MHVCHTDVNGVAVPFGCHTTLANYIIAILCFLLLVGLVPKLLKETDLPVPSLEGSSYCWSWGRV